MRLKCFATTVVALLLAVGFAPVGNAQIDREKTLFTIGEPLDVGGTVLQPGTYLIKIMKSSSNRSIVQVTNTDQSKTYALVLATPHPIKGDTTIPESRFTYFPATSTQPQALRTWFSGDTSTGQDIIYPKRRAEELAVVANTTVIAVPDETKPAEYEKAELIPVKPTRLEKTPPATTVAEQAPAKLPKTASSVPLTALLGVLALGGAAGLRILANRS